MTDHDHLGFVVLNSAIQTNIFIPRYYNPEIANRLAQLRGSRNLILLGDLIEKRLISVSAGDEIGKMAYGTGAIPFIRTSDISNWEIKADPKQGVREEIHAQYAAKQDVRPGDLFFVRDGTYLIGSSCLLTEADSRILFQSHILKLRVVPESPVSAPLLLAILSCPIVRRQIRAKQFTADIIDTIGNRYRELVLPVPRGASVRERITKSVLDVVHGRMVLRERLRRIPLWAQGVLPGPDADLPAADDEDFELGGNPGFVIPNSVVRRNIFIPRYYDPTVGAELHLLSRTHSLAPLSDLVRQGTISFDTGIEVGKMAYGTGRIPFIRTSDISNWELKADPKQSVAEDIYEQYKAKLDVRPGDIFTVRDGTYLVGTSCILTEHDGPLLYCGGIYKVRVKRPDLLDPYLLLVLLNCPIVRKQMRAKQFTRDIIDTLGKRIFEVVLPIPKDPSLRKKIAEVTREMVEGRAALREEARQITLEVEGVDRVTADDQEPLETL